MSKINRAAEHQLTAKDNIVQQYRSIYNSTEGALFLSKQRVLFIQSQGFLRKTYRVILNLPYDAITKTSVEASHRFTITVTNDTFTFVTIGIQANIVDDTLQHLIESAKPKPKAATTTVKVSKPKRIKRTRKK
jgi:predicted Zn-dependent protease